MGRVRSNSSPELLPSTRDLMHQDCAHLEGLSTNVKLLMKLLHDATEEDDGRNPQRVAGMMAILDDVKARIEKSQLPKRPRIHPCNSDSRRNGGAPPTTRLVKQQDPIAEENHQLRRELSASITAQKSLMRMFASLGKEKEDMASELARRVQEFNDVEQLVGDLRAQNEKLAEKVKACTVEHGGEKLKLRSKTMVAGIDRIRGGFGMISRGEEGMIKEVGEMIVSM